MRKKWCSENVAEEMEHPELGNGARYLDVKQCADIPMQVPDHAMMLYAVLGMFCGIRTEELLCRQPAFLIGTDPDLAVEKFVQLYLWRWGIEVDFREEKQLLGLGEAQVRTPASNQELPAMVVASYALPVGGDIADAPARQPATGRRVTQMAEHSRTAMTGVVHR